MNARDIIKLAAQLLQRNQINCFSTIKAINTIYSPVTS